MLQQQKNSQVPLPQKVRAIWFFPLEKEKGRAGAESAVRVKRTPRKSRQYIMVACRKAKGHLRTGYTLMLKLLFKNVNPSF